MTLSKRRSRRFRIAKTCLLFGYRNPSKHAIIETDNAIARSPRGSMLERLSRIWERDRSSRLDTCEFSYDGPSLYSSQWLRVNSTSYLIFRFPRNRKNSRVKHYFRGPALPELPPHLLLERRANDELSCTSGDR